MSGSQKEKSKLAESIQKASLPASSGTPAMEKNLDELGLTASNESQLAAQLRLLEILPLLKVQQNQTPGWVVVGGAGENDNLLAIESQDISAVLWDPKTNQIHLSSRENGLICLDCVGTYQVPQWQKRLTIALLAGLVDRLPFPFSVESSTE